MSASPSALHHWQQADFCLRPELCFADVQMAQRRGLGVADMLGVTDRECPPAISIRLALAPAVHVACLCAANLMSSEHFRQAAATSIPYPAALLAGCALLTVIYGMQLLRGKRLSSTVGSTCPQQKCLELHRHPLKSSESMSTPELVECSQLYHFGIRLHILCPLSNGRPGLRLDFQNLGGARLSCREAFQQPLHEADQLY